MKQRAAKLGVVNHIHFLGFVDNAQIKDVYKNLNILVLPSLPEMLEGLPLSILEGLANGCLVVATPNSGVVDVVKNNQTGFLVRPNDPEDLANGIMKAFSLSKNEREIIVQNGLNLILNNYTIEKQVTMLGKLFREIHHEIISR